MNINPAEFADFLAFREYVFAEIRKAFARDGYGKSYEGAIELAFPSVSDDARIVLRLHCYVIGPHRHYEFEGESLRDATAKARAAFESWVAEDAAERATWGDE